MIICGVIYTVIWKAVFETLLISICIPAYKSPEYLERLLHSIAAQTFHSFEVIVTDDSPDNSVFTVCSRYRDQMTIHYNRNPVALGTPANWNAALELARGEWIKIMHDDDWFYDADSLGHFAAAASEEKGDFIFSAYSNVTLSSMKEQLVRPNGLRLAQFRREPASLLSRNVVGPPSVVLHRNDKKVWYDPQFKWLVDIDFYLHRLATGSRVHFIDLPLIKVGVGAEQVTAYCREPEVEIPEHLYFLEKNGNNLLRHPMVYDAYWRMLRNFNITNPDQLREAGYQGNIPQRIERMVAAQRRIPRILLKTGIFSKFFMFVHYLFNRRKI